MFDWMLMEMDSEGFLMLTVGAVLLGIGGLALYVWRGKAQVRTISVLSIPVTESRKLTALLLVGILSIVSAFTLRATLDASEVELPIRVFPADGFSQHYESVTVNVSDASNVDRLWVKAHNVGGFHGEEDLVSIRINGGSWIDVNDSNATCRFTAERYGCIGGALSTIRFTIPAMNAVDGANTIDFRFNGSGGIRSGFRVLYFDFLESGMSLQSFSKEDVGTRGAIDGTDFVYDDPSTWSAPEGYDDQSSIDAGAQLWSERNILIEGGPDSRSIQAACGDCHASDGRDLKYFAYSNESIVSRSRFHGLSSEEGKQIAAYIRSQTLRREDGSTYDAPGTPWDPPYQPGPGLDDKPVQEWAAGAGLEHVLDTGAEMIPYLFPNGFSLDDVRTDSTLNVRELPVPVQFADWNTWLPVVHPLDATIFNQDFSGSELQNEWESGQSLFTNQHDFDPTGKEGDIKSFFTDFDLKGHKFMEDRDSNTDVTSDRWDQTRGVRNWVLVKSWEVIHKNNLENDGDQFFPSEEDGITYGEKRSWPTDNARNVFDISPHISGDNDKYTTDHRAYGTPTRSDFYDSEWYYKQMVLNPGSRDPLAHNPMDWKYHFSHLITGVDQYDIGVAGMYMASFVKMIQQLDNRDGVNASGWWVRHIEPSWLGQLVFPYNSFDNPFEGWSSEKRKQATEEIWRAYMIKTMSYDVENLPRGDDQHQYDDETTTPTLESSGSPFPPEIQGDQASQFYRWTNELDKMGVSASLVDSTAQWGEKMWPNGDWEQWMGKPGVTFTSPTSDFFTAPASLLLAADATDPDGSIQSVTFSANGTKLAEITSEPYEYTWSDVPAGSYNLSVTATDDAGNTVSSGMSVTVATTGTAPNGVLYDYYEGSWSQLPNFGSLTPLTSDTTDVPHLSVRERDDEFALRFTGYIEIPASETGSYTFYTTSDDGSRLLINGQEIVNNDGTHGAEEKSGSLNLDSGWHKIVVQYFEAGGGQELSVSWNGPTFTKEQIPGSRLFVVPESGVSQAISLAPGWNVISSHVAPDTAALETVFRDASVEVVKDENNNLYVPSENRNEIGAWDSTEAYKVYTESSQTLSIEGTTVEEKTTIPLQKGWNLIPYLPPDARSVSAALESIETELVLLKDEAGNTYVPAYGVDEIGQLTPENGYQVYVNADVDLVYSSGD